MANLRAVDWITHAALGAAVGEAVLGKRLGNRALAWGAAFGILPDLPMAFSLFLDTTHELLLQRGPSHSLLALAIGAWFLGRGLAKLWKKDKITRARATSFVVLAVGMHLLIDCCTVHGTAVAWPFTKERVAFNLLWATDPLFAAPLIVTLVWLAFMRNKKQQAKRRRLGGWGLGLSAAYVLFCLGMKNIASDGFENDLKNRGITYERRMEAPTPFNSLLWRSVVDRGDELWVGYRSIFDSSSTPIRWTIYPRRTAALVPVAGTREVRALSRICRGWWIARPNKKGVWLGDLRFGESRAWGVKEGFVDTRLAFSWLLDLEAQPDRLSPSRPVDAQPMESFRRMARRLAGDREAWEGNPRLADIRGSLPEFLTVVE